MKRRWIIAWLLLLAIPFRAAALNGSGYIQLKMAYDGKPVAGGTVTIFDVSDCPVDIGPVEMIVYVHELGLPGTEKEVKESGYVRFEDLYGGRYLLVQQKAPEGYYPIKPFLIQLSAAADGTQVDCIDAAPKLEPEEKLPQTGQLVWPAWLLLGSGITLVGMGLIIRKRE